MTDCPLCKRQMGQTKSKHHTTPIMFGGKETVYLHKICHDKIHTVFTERELKNEYNIIEKIKENEEIVKFIKWVSKKDPDFYDKPEHTNRRHAQFKYKKG